MREIKDIIGGGLLVLIGGFAAFYAAFTLRLGTIWQMGPGMFPAAVGVIIFLLGAGIMISGLLREGGPVRFDWRPLGLISAAVFAFALLIRPFGLVPAIVALVFICSRADNKLSPPRAVLLAGVLSLLAVIIFPVGLGLPWPLFRWPW